MSSSFIFEGGTGWAVLGNANLPDTAVTPGTYGDGTHVGQFTVNQKGVITAASSVGITGGGGGPTIIRGSVEGNGTIDRGSGFTVSRTSTGHYTVTFSPTLSAAPVVVISAWGDVANAGNLSNAHPASTPPTATSFEARTANPGSTAYVDCGFDFIAVVP